MKYLILILFPLTILAQNFGNWIEVDSMNNARIGHAMVLLKNGNVLISGNDRFDSVENRSCEIFDKSTNTWQSTTSTNSPKDNHHLILLDNGEILAFGGLFGRKCEIFNPITEEWRFTDSIPTDRNFGEEAFLKLSDGRVMVIGGQHSNFDGNPMLIYSNCEIYNPQTEKWEIAAPLITKRASHSAVLLNDGRVLVSGGSNRYIENRVPKGQVLKSCEIYNPKTNSWIETDSLKIARYRHSQILLDNGNVLLLGGITVDSSGRPTPDNSCAIFDVNTEKWHYLDPLLAYRDYHGVFRLNEKYLIIVGGDVSDSWEIYDLEKSESVYLELLGSNQIINRFNTIQLENKNILIAGGEEWFEDGIGGLMIAPTKRCWIFDIYTDVNEVTNKLENFELTQNYPNPFNPSTSIEYTIIKPSKVKIIVYDILGNIIKTLIDENTKAGVYKTIWDGKNESGINQPSGVYLIKLIAGNYVQTKKAILLK